MNGRYMLTNEHTKNKIDIVECTCVIASKTCQFFFPTSLTPNVCILISHGFDFIHAKCNAQ